MKQVDRNLRHLFDRLMDRGQLRGGEGGYAHIIKTDNPHLIRHRDMKFTANLQSLGSNQITVGEQTVRLGVL